MMGTINGNELRRHMQEKAVDAVIKDRFVIVNWGTGVGKSRVGIGAVEEMFRRGALRILLLVDQTLHKQNWLKEFQDACGEEHGRRLYESITVECYASLPKYVGSRWDLVVADEAHHLRGENRIQQLATIKAERILCLSATVSCKGDGEDLLLMLNTTFGIFRSFDFGVQEAIDRGILAEPVIHIHVLPLKEMTARQIIDEVWGRKEKRVELKCTYDNYKDYLDRRMYPAATMHIECSASEAYEYYLKQFRAARKRYAEMKDSAADGDLAAKAALERAENRVVRYGGQRKIFIGQLKTVFTKALLKRLEGKKYLCFCADVDQAVELGGENVIFSGRREKLADMCPNFGSEGPKYKDNKDVVEAFNAGEIRSLFAVNMIQEGQNLSGIEAGITVQLAGKDRQFIQRFGRTLRSKNPEQHIVVVSGTKDADYLRESLSGISREYFVFHGYGSLKGKVRSLDDVAGDPEETAPRRRGTVGTPGGLFGNKS